MKKRLLIIILVSVFIASASFAQENAEKPVEKEYRNNVGFAAGLTTGFGFAYKYKKGKNGIQLALFPLGIKHFTLVSLGVTVMHSLYQGETIDFYLYQGNHFLFSSADPYGDYIAGLGLGADFSITGRVDFSLMGGGALINYDVSHHEFLPSIEVAIFYKF